MSRSLALGVAFVVGMLGGSALADVPAEEPGVVPAPPLSPHWVFLTDAAFMHLTEGKIVIVDGDQAKVLSKLSTGYLANSLLSADGKELYVVETFWSRGTRGERTDVVTIFDMATDRRWTLLALYADQSYVRDKTALDLGRKLVTKLHSDGKRGMTWNPDSRYVELFVNSEYKGLYLLAEKGTPAA